MYEALKPSGLPYTEFAIADQVAFVRDLAGLPKNLQLRDLKRTSTTETRMAGATDHEMQATTGNNKESLQIYSVPQNAEATAAIRKRLRYRTKLKHKVRMTVRTRVRMPLRSARTKSR